MYHDWPSLEHVYLEDSYVLDIAEAPDQFSVTLEAVLTPGHQAFSPPKRDQQYCYVLGLLAFAPVSKVVWEARNPTPVPGQDNEIDFGNVDFLTRTAACYHLGGEWGAVKVHAKDVHFELLDATHKVGVPLFLEQTSFNAHKMVGAPSARLPHYRHR